MLAGVVLLHSCKKFDKMLQNPNSPTPETANVDLYLNSIQLSFTNFYGVTGVEPGLSENGEEMTRMEYMAARRYQDVYQPESFDGAWREAYQGILKNGDALIPVAEKSSRVIHIGIAQVLKAYTFATLVDFFGDVPYTEANLGIENTNPKADLGKDIYDKVFVLLDSAISNFNKATASTAVPTNDLFYASITGATAKAGAWRRAAKTLKLKLYNQIRLVDNSVKDKINALLADGELITTDAQAFVFKYGSKALNPNSRHPKYSTYYTTAGAQDYVGNYFAYVVFAEKGAGLDPRWRYYFYRQISNVTIIDPSVLNCLTSTPPAHYPADAPYCYAHVAGFYGRDHGDDQGIPPDGFQRLCWGVYPCAGRFDNSDAARVNDQAGGQGAGILPVWQPAFTEFVKAEAALKLGTTGDARALLESGIRKSITTVVDFPKTISYTIPRSATGVDRDSAARKAIDPYVNAVLALYDAATTDDERLDIIMKEYYIALWGNGIESYNNYRRTGMPKNMQPNLNPAAGLFLRSMPFPNTYANRNANVTQKTATNIKVFWDNNPDNIYVN